MRTVPDEMGCVDRHNNFRQCCTRQKYGKQNGGRLVFNLNYWGLQWLMRISLVVKSCLNGGSRPMSERQREGEDENPTLNCKHVGMGQYRVNTGTYL
jgi:hypothetical protein